MGESSSSPNSKFLDKTTVKKIFRCLYRAVELDELTNMLADRIIPGDLEADETFLKSGGKYPGRGRYVSKKNSMVSLFGMVKKYM